LSGVGGMTGMLLTGVFASKAVNSAVTDQGLILKLHFSLIN
jgi:Amt family ammonium transporter